MPNDGGSSPFGVALRGWRERADPVDFGLAAHRGRRVPGLSRNELATLSGLSVDYVKLLEQGRGSTPSAQVVSALARALRLAPGERDYLFRCAGQVPPRGDVPLDIHPAVERIVDRLPDRPAMILAADWTVLGWNDLWVAAAGDPAKYDWPFDNVIAAAFLDEAGRTVDEIGSWPVRSSEGAESTETALVADLRFAAAAYPADRRLAAMIERLMAGSARFAELWRTGTAGVHSGRTGVIEHPLVGDIHVDSEIMMAPGSDQKIQALTPRAGTPAVARLDILRRDSRRADGRSITRLRPTA
jgi:transcriptional regulator with XRE-family HTH domain